MNTTSELNTTERTVHSYDGALLHVFTTGPAQAPSIMLSHALGTTAAIWDGIVSQLAGRFQMIRFDTRGHGRSGVPEGPYSVDMLGRDALSVLDALATPSVSFIGLSQGGMTGMWLAAHHPHRIERLVIANSTAYIPVKGTFNEAIGTALQVGMSAVAEQTIKRWLCKAYQTAHPQGVEALVSTMQAMSPQGFAGAMAMLRDVDLRADLARIRCPTLVIAGIEDGLPGETAAAALVSGIGGARRIDLPAAAHLSPVENPTAFNEAVMAFLAH